MSENSAKQSTAGCSQTCEDESLIIEVIGKEHPDGHAFRIFDETNYEQQEWLEKQVEIEPLENSILHVWPWKGQPSRNVWIEIKSEDGPIRVPFLDDATSTEREVEHQRHVVLPVVPATLLSGIELHGQKPARQVLARAGFLYIFYKEKLWREIEIRIDEEGQTSYHDVALTKYRSRSGQLEPGYRKVTGSAMSEIWIPARINSDWLTLEMAFSESQWPGERVMHVERSATDRENRCVSIDMRFGSETKESVENSNTSNGNSVAFLAEYLSPQRSRVPALEWQFDRPDDYLLDLEGTYPDRAMQKAKSIHQRQESPDPEDPIAEDERPEMTALSNCLHRSLHQAEEALIQQCRPEDPEPFTWPGSGTAETDATINAKKRGIGVILLDDPIYQLRYNQRRRQVAAWYMNAAVRRAKARPYFDSALLVHSVIEPEHIASEPNQLHKHMAEINNQGRAELERSLAVSERQMGRAYLEKVHSELLELLSNERTHHVLTDLFTHDSYDYAGAFNFVTSLVMNLVTEPAECDALDIDVEGAVDGEGKHWLQGLCEGRHSRVLYSLLFPRFSPEDQKKPYQPPAEPQVNHGNGQFRETELAAMSITDLPDIEELKTIDGLELAVEAAAGSYETLLTANMRLGSQVLMSVHGNMWAAIHHASQAIEARNAKLAAIKKQLAELRIEISNLENQRWNIERRINNLRGKEAELEAIRNKLIELDVRFKELSRQKQSIMKTAVAGRMKLYSVSLEQLRRSLPELLGKVELMRLSKARQKDYFIFEFSEAELRSGTGKRAVELFGDLIQAGEEPDVRASTSRRRSKAAGIASEVAEDVYVLAVPKTETVVTLIEDIRKAESDFRQAVRALAELDELVGPSPGTPAAAMAAAAQRIEAAKAEVARAERELKAFEQEIDSRRSRVAKKEQYIRDLEAANDAANKIDQAEINSNRSSRLYRVLNKPAFPVFVGLIEVFNSASVWSGRSQDARIKGNNRAGLRVFSAGFDLFVAGTAISERWVLGPSKILALELPEDIGRVFVKSLGAPLTVRSGLGAAAGFLMALDAGWDAYYEYRMGNHKAAFGYGLLAGSGIAFGFASVVGKSGLLLVLGPKGWLAVGVILAVAGLATVFAFSDEPLDIWMRHGPFGPLAEKPFLKKPDEAYYRLISQLMGVTVRLEYNPLRRMARDGVLEGYSDDQVAALSMAGERFVIESAIPELFNSGGVVTVLPKLQLNETIAVAKGRSGHVQNNRIEGADLEPYVLMTEESGTGLHIYLNAPESARRKLETAVWQSDTWETRTYRWKAKVQIQARQSLESMLMVFPAPPPQDPLVFSKSDERHTQPDFSSEDQPFWYSQRVQENVD